jgi:cyclopropane fatty-acyl-phospholipid synthase-like methyltransferase
VADRRDADFTYSLTDRIIRLSLGELPDFSGAKFDGDFSLGLEQAQRRKHDYVAQQVGIGPGRRLLDLGCGWGPLLAYTRARGGAGVGVTLSSAQLAACRQHGLAVYLEDAREIDRERFGAFDAVASLGAFERFCSPDDYQAGRQEEIYRDLFARVSSVLPPGGRFYLQTMVSVPTWSRPHGSTWRRSERSHRETLTSGISRCWGASSRTPGCRSVKSRSFDAPSRTSGGFRPSAAVLITSRRSTGGTRGSGRRVSERRC